MKRIAMRTAVIWALIVALLGGVVFFLVEYFMKADQWVLSQGSPHIYNGDNINTGIVVDREGYLLLDTSGDRTYSTSSELRSAMIHWLGDRYGYISSPAIAYYAKEMAGFDPVTGLYANGGGQAMLTISAKLQVAAQKAIGDRKGTVALYNYKTGELLCALTTPNYDPDNVPELSEDESGAYEGLYVNRFIQSAYIPGSIFKLVTTAAALEQIEDIQEQTFVCTGKQEYGSKDVTCEIVHGELDFDSALAQSCNCAFAQIVEQLGRDNLQKYVDKYNVTQPISFDGLTTVSGNFDLFEAASVQVAWSGIGQHKDQINPCRYLTFMGAVANDGVEVMPHLVQKVTVSGQLTYHAEPVTGERIMSEKIARELQRMMRNNVEEKYGVENFPDINVCAKSGTAQVGGDKKANAMFTGFLLEEDYPIAFFIAVENAGYGREVCVPILNEVLKVLIES